MKLGKLKIELIIVLVLLVAGLGIWWFVATEAERTADREVEAMIKYAQRQALEIAIIEQASKLANYKRQLAKVKQPVPIVPVITDPIDVNR